MNYYIEEMEKFRVAGYKKAFGFKNGENFVNIPLFWKEIFKNGNGAKLMELNNTAPKGFLGICGNLREDEFDYLIAVSTDKNISDDMEEMFIEKQTYAVFTCSMEKIQETTKHIFSTWLPNSEYSYVESPTFEFYPDEVSCLIYVPIKSK